MVPERLGPIEKFFLNSAWFWAAILFMGILGVLSLFPELVGLYFRDGFYYYQRVIVDSILNALPFSSFWIFLFILLAGLFQGIKQGRISRFSWYLNGIGKLVMWFYIFWGLNYRAPGLAHKLNLNQTHQVAEIDDYLILIDKLEDEMAPNFCADYRRAPSHKVSDMRKVVSKFLKKNQIKAAGNPGVQVLPIPFLRWIGISGIYLPYSFEAYVDGSLSPSQKTFTIAHELVHAYGFTSEAEANFAACAAFIDSDNQELRQLARLELIFESLRRIRRLAPEEFETVHAKLSADLREEIEFRRKDRANYENWFWTVSEYSNDHYLKFQGEHDGVESYSGFLELYLDWRHSTTP